MDVIGHIPMALSPEYVLEAGQKLIAHSEEFAKHAGGDHSVVQTDRVASTVAARGAWVIPTRPFEYLGELDRAGAVEVGKRSDLILVGENPLEDVAGASAIAGVLVRGRWIGADEIGRRLRRVAASGAGRPAGPAPPGEGAARPRPAPPPRSAS
jgi:hypothetical protein